MSEERGEYKVVMSNMSDEEQRKLRASAPFAGEITIMPNPLTWVDEIAGNVRARGYVQGDLTREQYCFRQLCKTVDELCEYAACFEGGDAVVWLRSSLRVAASYVARYFAEPERIGHVSIREENAGRELADVLVTLAMGASVLGIDVERAAREKSAGDVTRGVR